MNRVVTCVYCGHEYPEGTPTSQNEDLTAHIKVCPKHPMSALEAENRRLREAYAFLFVAGWSVRALLPHPEEVTFQDVGKSLRAFNRHLSGLPAKPDDEEQNDSPIWCELLKTYLPCTPSKAAERAVLAPKEDDND